LLEADAVIWSNQTTLLSPSTITICRYLLNVHPDAAEPTSRAHWVAVYLARRTSGTTITSSPSIL
jgi:hypothetical protein